MSDSIRDSAARIAQWPGTFPKDTVKPDDQTLRQMLTDAAAVARAARALALAVGKLEYDLPKDDDGVHYCPWCHWSDEGNLAAHEPDCPFTLARVFLAE